MRRVGSALFHQVPSAAGSPQGAVRRDMHALLCAVVNERLIPEIWVYLHLVHRWPHLQQGAQRLQDEEPLVARLRGTAGAQNFTW